MYNPGCPSPDLRACKSRGFLRQELLFMSLGASEDFCSWPGHLLCECYKTSVTSVLWEGFTEHSYTCTKGTTFLFVSVFVVPWLCWKEEHGPFHLPPCPWRALWVFLGCLNIWDTEFWHRNVVLCGDQQSESWKQSSSLWRVSRPALWISTSGWSCAGGSTGDAQKASPHSAASPSPCLCDLLTPVRCRAFSCKKSCSAQEELCLLHCNSKM